MRFIHLSLRGRIVGLISAIFVLVLGVTSWVDIQITRSNLLSIQDQRALLIAQPILKDVERLTATMQLKDLAYLLTRHSVSLLEKYLKDGVRSIVVIRRSDAVVLAHSDPSGSLGQTLENADLKTAVQNPEINHYLSEDALHSLVTLGKDNEAVIDISWDRSTVDEPFTKRVISSTIWFLVSSLIAALSASYFLKKILRQVNFPEQQGHGVEQNSLQRLAPTRTPKMKLVTKAILLVVSLLVLLFGTFSAIVLQHHERSLRESVLAGVDGMARANALTVSGFIADSMRSAEAITANLPIKAFQKGDFGAVNQYLREASLLSRFDNGIFILDAQGMLRADFPHHPEVQGTSFAYREYFIRTVKEKRGVISEPYESKRTGSPVLTFTRPVFDIQGQLIAVVACSMNLLESEALGQLLNQNVFNYGYLFLFDKSRLIIIHPDIERVLKRDIPEGSNDLLDRAINGQEGVGETVNSRGMPMLSAFRSVPNSSWFVGVQVQQSQAYANLRDSRRLLLGILGISLIAVILICIIAIHRITRPLLFLHSAARLVVHELETGDKSDPVKIQKLLSLIRSQDEMGDLALAFGELVNRQRESVGMLRDANSALEESNGKLAALSTTDGLTGIANRRYFDESLQREHAHLCRSTGYLSLIFLDVDFFKKFNDHYGHLQGDDCLRKIAQVMANAMQRPNDLAARYGGEEFAFILPDTDQEGAIIIAERIRMAVIDLAIPHETSSVSNIVTVSMGVLTAKGGSNSADYLLEQTDKLLYQAKSEGRNRCAYYAQQA